ncbi:MAG TPA: hypothetical protein VK524_33630, partial [Polyangiaceae bacterium]|nr:hypothetical protein [Polyangiaceae bacterium]
MSGVRLAKPFTLGELVARFGGVCDDSLAESAIERVVSAAALAPAAARGAGFGTLVLWTSARHAPLPLPEQAVCLCSRALAERLPVGRRWLHDHALWVVSELLAERAAERDFRRAANGAAGRVAPDVIVDPGAVIHEQVSIGAGSRIGPNAVLYG